MGLGREIALIKALGGSSGGGGGGSGALVVNVSVADNGDDTYTFTCDKTAGEMYEAAPNLVFLLVDGGFKRVGQLRFCAHSVGYVYAFATAFEGVNSDMTFATSTDSPSEYPSYTTDGGGQ